MATKIFIVFLQRDSKNIYRSQLQNITLALFGDQGRR